MSREHPFQKKSSDFTAFMNILIATIEIGIVATPVAFSKCGWLAGMIIVPGIGNFFLCYIKKIWW